MLLLGCTAVAVYGWGRLGVGAMSVSHLCSRGTLRAGLVVGAVGALWIIFGVLRTWASFDVRDDGRYLFMYTAMGMTWTWLASGPWIGVSARDDVVERGNTAALIAWTGAVLGAAACFAGGNVGDGPGWWCVVWASGIATFGYLLTWTILHRTTHIADHVTIDRDVAASIRAASFLLATGVVWGRSAAGDWTSAIVTLVDFKGAWPVLVLLLKAIAVERTFAPSSARPHGHIAVHGLIPCAFDLAWVTFALRMATPLADHYPVPGAS